MHHARQADHAVREEIYDQDALRTTIAKKAYDWAFGKEEDKDDDDRFTGTGSVIRTSPTENVISRVMER